MDVSLLFFTCIASLRMILAALVVKVEPREITLLEGETLTAMCRVNESLFECRWDGVDRSKALHVKPGAELPKGIEYHGRGLDNGECGITISKVSEDHNGVLICHVTPTFAGSRAELDGKIFLTVAKEPRDIQINVTRIETHLSSDYSNNTFEEYNRIQAECTINYGRPAANISWYIGTERILDGLDTPVIRDLESKEQRIMQNLSTMLTYLDNGKDLRCVADHITFGPGTLQHPNFTLNVYFKPKFGKIKPCAFIIGKSGKILVPIHANPKPKIEWLIGGESIPEGGRDKTGRFHALFLSDEKNGQWEAVINITVVRPEDVKKNYKLTAKNSVGEKDYEGVISACGVPSVAVTASSASPVAVPACPSPTPDVTSCPPSSPEVLACPAPSVDVTAWSIAGTAITIILIIVRRSILIVCRATGSRLQKMKINYSPVHQMEETEEMTTEL